MMRKEKSFVKLRSNDLSLDENDKTLPSDKGISPYAIEK